MTTNKYSKMENLFYERAGIYAKHNGVPKSKEQRIYFGMLEAIGYECFKYKDLPKNITERMVKNYLIKHKERIRVEAIADYISLFSGGYNFLNFNNKYKVIKSR